MGRTGDGGLVLAVNAGSSSLRFALYTGVEPQRIASGVVERVGSDRSALDFAGPGGTHRATEAIDGHAAAARSMLDWLADEGFIADPDLLIVGHRVVHGGSLFRDPTLIDSGVEDAIEELAELAPLHNPPALAGIRACRERLGAAAPMVAAFDTAFFSRLPERARHYAIPHSLADRHGIFRYGFHGLAHQYMVDRAAVRLGAELSGLSLITLQLGAGCSAAAVAGGTAIDTTMGLTPLEGLMMATRSGNIDPSVVEMLARKEGLEPAAVIELLNKQSGLLGVSGHSHDMRDLIAAAENGDERARLAIELFAYRVTTQIGAYAAALGELDAIAFGGGIGENDAVMRERICATLSILGVAVDPVRNRNTVGREADVATDDSSVRVLVVPVDEMLVIAAAAASVAGTPS